MEAELPVASCRSLLNSLTLCGDRNTGSCFGNDNQKCLNPPRGIGIVSCTVVDRFTSGIEGQTAIALAEEPCFCWLAQYTSLQRKEKEELDQPSGQLFIRHGLSGCLGCMTTNYAPDQLAAAKITGYAPLPANKLRRPLITHGIQGLRTLLVFPGLKKVRKGSCVSRSPVQNKLSCPKLTLSDRYHVLTSLRLRWSSSKASGWFAMLSLQCDSRRLLMYLDVWTITWFF